MDRIIMKGMKFFGYHGVFPQEKKLGQLFEVDLEIYLDLKNAGVNDDLNQTISYADLFKLVEEVVTKKTYDLVEAVAQNISSKVLKNYNQIKKVKVIVKKPNAPIDGNFDYMAVEIFRDRD